MSKLEVSSSIRICRSSSARASSNSSSSEVDMALVSLVKRAPSLSVEMRSSRSARYEAN